MTAGSHSLRWLFWFGLTLSVLVGFALWASMRLPSYRHPPVNFYAMQPGEYYDMLGLTRRQSGGVKLGFAETYPAPPIGAFGNHIIEFFGADAFGAPERAEVFFNYSYANLSLPELLVFLRHIDARGRLPSDLIIISVTPPNADNGEFIINRGNELPNEILLEDRAAQSGAEAPSLALTLWNTLELQLHEVFNYNTLIFGVVQGPRTSRITGPVGCQRAEPQRAAPGWLQRLPWTVRSRLERYFAPDTCATRGWREAVRRDGSLDPNFEFALVLQDQPLPEAGRGLHAGDERAIAANLQAINQVAGRHGATVVFLITPVFETDRSDSVVNQVFDRALALAPELEVIDHRGLHDDAGLFCDTIHPGPAYYRLVVEELRQRGLYGAHPG